MRKCPKCGSPRVHRSRTKGFVEQLRKHFSAKRPHRCHACQWRGWGVETRRPAAADTQATGGGPGPELVDQVEIALPAVGTVEHQKPRT